MIVKIFFIATIQPNKCVIINSVILWIVFHDCIFRINLISYYSCNKLCLTPLTCTLNYHLEKVYFLWYTYLIKSVSLFIWSILHVEKIIEEMYELLGVTIIIIFWAKAHKVLLQGIISNTETVNSLCVSKNEKLM